MSWRRVLLSGMGLCLLAAGVAGCRSPLSQAQAVPAPTVSASPEAPPWKSPWTAYDVALCDAIGEGWVKSLEANPALVHGGRVVVRFALLPDGQVTDLGVLESGRGECPELICRKAVLDCAPFPRWPGIPRQHAGRTRWLQIAFEFDLAGEPYLTCWESRFEVALPAELSEEAPLAIYYPRQQRLVSSAQRLWAAAVPAAVYSSARSAESSIVLESYWYPPLFWWPGPYDGCWWAGPPPHSHHRDHQDGPPPPGPPPHGGAPPRPPPHH